MEAPASAASPAAPEPEIKPSSSARGAEEASAATPTPESGAAGEKEEAAPSTGREAEAAVAPGAQDSVPKTRNAKDLPVRQYLEHTVVPAVMQAMQRLVKERPEDPVKALAAYLLEPPAKKAKSEGARGEGPKSEAAEAKAEASTEVTA